MNIINITYFIFLLNLLQLTYTFDARRGFSVARNKLNRNPHIKTTNQTNKLKQILYKFSDNPYTENYFKTKVDHFSYDNSKTFDLRYLVSTKYYSIGGPILFYCGNEDNIEEFWGASGFIIEDLAKSFHGLVIFAEHRFFGKSFPNKSAKQDFDIKKNKYLTVEQAMNDFVDLIQYYKKNNKNVQNSPVIAFGGSYGGMLSAWSRMKFPHVFAGAVASSAPILLFDSDNQDKNSFFKIVTETYTRYDNNCPIHVREGFNALLSLRNNTYIQNNPDIIQEINEIFNPCKKITNLKELTKLEAVIEDTVILLAQLNYPYEVAFPNILPAYPVKVACEKIASYNEESKPFSMLFESAMDFSLQKYGKIDVETKRRLNYLKIVLDLTFNSTGKQECLDIGNDDSKVQTPNGWEFLACSEMIMPMETNGVTDMFNPQKWDLEQFSKECKNRWNADIRPDFAFNYYGGRNLMKDFNSYSNLYFINGKMDPWNAGCVQISPNPSGMTVFLSDSAHHLDLRSPNKNDPDTIVKAREVMKVLIEKWILEFMTKSK